MKSRKGIDIMENVVMEQKSELQLFQKEEFGTIRTVIINGEPWFVVADIARITKQKNPSDIKKRKYINYKMVKLDRYSGSGVNIIDLDSMLKILQSARKISSSYKEKFIDFLIQNGVNINKENIILFEYEEITFFNSLIEFLSPFKVEVKQNYRIGNYHVDFYIKDWNVIIEYDERNHENYNIQKEKEREDFLTTNTGGKLIRVSNKKSNEYNLGVIAKDAMEFISTLEYIEI